MKLAAGVEYDGSRFGGWQRQQSGRTVQAVLEEALSRVADEPISVVCAGRTDRGVHAHAQVIHFETTAQRLAYNWILGTNTNLPNDVAVNWLQPVREDFSARFSALRRRYRYIIDNRRFRAALFAHHRTWERRPLDVERMAAATPCLVGEHDFSAFRAAECQSRSPMRLVTHLHVHREGELVMIDVEANAFLHHMVRNIAGVLIQIGVGEQDPAWSRTVLESKDRRCAGVTAPANGLYLVGVDYPPGFGLPELSRHWAVW